MEAISLESIYFMSQTIAAIAIVGSLFYLARQIRFAHQAASDFTRHGRATAVQTWMMAIASNDELTHCWAKAADHWVNDKEGSHPLAAALGLSINEAAKVELLCTYGFWANWGQFASTKSSEDLDEIKNIIASMYASEPWATVWRLSGQRKLLDPRFVEFVDEVLRDANHTPST